MSIRHRLALRLLTESELEDIRQGLMALSDDYGQRRLTAARTHVDELLTALDRRRIA